MNCVYQCQKSSLHRLELFVVCMINWYVWLFDVQWYWFDRHVVDALNM